MPLLLTREKNEMKVAFYKREFNGQMRDFVRIPIVDTVDVLETPVRPIDIKRFNKEWLAYKGSEKKKPSGTELTSLPGITENKRIELELKNIETIEELAKAKKPDLLAMGDVYIELQRIAELHMAAESKKPKAVPKPKETEKAE